MYSKHGVCRSSLREETLPSRSEGRHYSQRRGAASVVLSFLLLTIVTATALTTMRGHWASRKAAEANESRSVLLAAIDAAQSLPIELLAEGVRLPVAENQNRWIAISVIRTEEVATMLQATELHGDKVGLSMKRELQEDEK